MKRTIAFCLGAALIMASCTVKNDKVEGFRYLVDEFADLKVMRYTIPGWENLTLQQKEYAYHLAEAAKWGRDILWDQNSAGNIPLRHALENILNNYKGERAGEDWDAFVVYAKRVFFSNGVHHHYAEDKFFPECGREYFEGLLKAVGEDAAIAEYVYDATKGLQRRSTETTGDIVKLSAVNFYEGVSREDVEKYYESIEVKGDPHPIAYGLNTKVVKQDGKVVELPWMKGGIYDGAISQICEELTKAAMVAENDIQKQALALLVRYYETGDLRVWDEFNIEWVKDTVGTVDFINGFIEDYNDPLGRKGAWEGYVNIKDFEASRRTETLSANAQ
ncbi:MAG: dihydrofolate reductase, partial [Bacteroidales bacterium]|nr:dihydrofolate reductase [Bacteroidales bacterium]